MAYYLIWRDLLLDKIQLVGSCKNHQSKTVILDNYCKNNNINLVTNRLEINEKCKGEELFTYKFIENKYIVLQCIDHPAGFIMSHYVEKHRVGFLEFVFFSETELHLSGIKNTLKMKVKRDLNTIN